MGKLGWKERKVVTTFLQLLKMLPEDKIPQSVFDELAKSGIIKEKDETMTDFSNKVLKHLKEVEKTL